jgi:AAT family amino acid transporter
MAAAQLKPRWGQPLTGIISFFTFFGIAWATWYILSDPRGPIGWFPYPFVMYLAMMILVGIWQHMFLGDWPFQNISQPLRGIIMTIANVVLVWFVIDIIFYRVLGIGMNVLSYYGLDELGKPGKLAQVAVVCFVLIGFYTYPVSTIFFGKWPVQPSNIKQPAAGFAELGWGTFLTLFAYTILILPFFGLVFKGPVLSAPWWTSLGGTGHVHWVFGWWEWAIIILFMTVNVWRMKPWSLIALPQPFKGIISVILSFIGAYLVALLCLKIIPMWVPAESFHHLEEAKGAAEVQRFLWLHSAEIAGFTLIPFLAWHHYFDDLAFGLDVDGWPAFFLRTIGVLALAAVSYWIFYYANFGHWGLGNHHMEELSHRFAHGESLIWNFWWIIPLLWNEWFFHKWPFYVHVEE